MAEGLAESLERAAAAGEALRSSDQAPTVTNMDAAAHGLATSKGRAKAALERGELDPLVKAANAKGLTLRALAKKAGLGTHTILSMARRGERPLRRSAAKVIETLTGFAATAANWPGGLAD